jgi:hypothetical protein
VIDYELRAALALSNAADVSAALRETIAREVTTDDAAYREACAALDAARERFWTARCACFPRGSRRSTRGGAHRRSAFHRAVHGTRRPDRLDPPRVWRGRVAARLTLIGSPGMDATIAGIAEQVAHAMSSRAEPPKIGLKQEE